VVNTPNNRGKTLKPNRRCKDPANFEFVISGQSDGEYGKDPERMHSVSRFACFLEGASISHKSRMQQSVTLSVSESELLAATEWARDMMFAKHVIESLGLKVKLPMLLEIDNEGAIDLCNNYSVGGTRTCHIDVKYWCLCLLKEGDPDHIVLPIYVPSEDNSCNKYTKSLGGELFKKHIYTFVGDDEYYN